MQRLWWVFCLLCAQVVGCASSVPVGCPEGFEPNGADCAPEPTDRMDDPPDAGTTPDAGPTPDASVCDDTPCDDDNECTIDGCDEEGCTNELASDGTACVFEAGAGVCESGTCVRDCEVEDCREVYPCTEQGLRDAVEDGGEIVIGCNGPTTVLLENGELDIVNDVSIDGLGLLTVDAQGTSRVFHVNIPTRAELIGMNLTGGSAATKSEDVGGAVSADSGTELGIRNCRIYGNTASIHGGGVRAWGTLTLEKVEIYDNLAANRGGGIAVSRETQITDSTIADNESEGGGGGIYATGLNAIVTIENSLIEGNRTADGGGGVWSSGAIILDGTTVRNNVSGESGGGVRSFGGHEARAGTLVTRNGTVFANNTSVGGAAIAIYRGAGEGTVISDTLFSGNTATAGSGGAIFNDETLLLVTDSVFEGNRATNSSGAVYSKRAETTFIRTSFSDHQARIGGGFRFLGNATERVDARFENCTISGSSATESGGTFFNARSTVILSHTTLTASTALIDGSGAHLSDGAEVHIENSVFDAGCFADPDSSLVSLGYSAVLTPTAEQCAFTPIEGLSTDLAMTSEEMGLQALADNGGDSRTHMPIPGSMLIDAIPAESCLPELDRDQRGEPRNDGSACDIGAVEVQPVE